MLVYQRVRSSLQSHHRGIPHLGNQHIPGIHIAVVDTIPGEAVDVWEGPNGKGLDSVGFSSGTTSA